MQIWLFVYNFFLKKNDIIWKKNLSIYNSIAVICQIVLNLRRVIFHTKMEKQLSYRVPHKHKYYVFDKQNMPAW